MVNVYFDCDRLNHLIYIVQVCVSPHTLHLVYVSHLSVVSLQALTSGPCSSPNGTLTQLLQLAV